MSKMTSIQWCDSTVNPVMGCAGCELWDATTRTCYAGTLHRRRRGNTGFATDFNSPKLFPGRTAVAATWPDLSGVRRPEKPWLGTGPRLIFVSDMGDALSEKGAVDGGDRPLPGGGVPFAFLKAEIVDVARSDAGQRHKWLWLTKRPARLGRFCDWLTAHHGIALPTNVWVGTSVTSRRTLGRVRDLQNVRAPGVLRFVSVEPLSEGISLAGHLGGIPWVIVGGESRQGSRPMQFRLEWARRLRDECESAGVPFFLKQLGSNVTCGGLGVPLRDGHGGNWEEWPDDICIRQVPVGQTPVDLFQKEVFK